MGQTHVIALDGTESVIQHREAAVRRNHRREEDALVVPYAGSPFRQDRFRDDGPLAKQVGGSR